MAREETSWRERMLFGTPARFMAPRIILLVTTFALVAFGLLMIYSSSSIVAMASEDMNYDPAYYVKRQLVFVAAGVVAAAVVALINYHVWSHRPLLLPIWGVTVFLLLLVLGMGSSAYGATRWIAIGPFNLQPSEFAKITIILVGTYLCTRCFESCDLWGTKAGVYVLFFIGIPLALIGSQPDKGTMIICAVTLLVMVYLSGFPTRYIWCAIAAGMVFVAFISLKDDYSRARVMMAWNPWRDPYGDGYQLIQGIYAFASGGLFGVGIGMSRQKYSYLPMAHNDFIFAVVGEELGLMGTLGMLAAFGVLAWAGFEIARYAPDLSGRLIAAGCTSMIIIQLLVNVSGVLGIIPLSGKPVPFVSYGGSSIISCLMLVGFVVSVSRCSTLPETVFDENRRAFEREAEGVLDEGGFSLVGEATPRSARSASPGAASSFSLVGSTSQRAQRSGSARAKDVLSRSASDTSIEGRRASRAFSEEHTGGRVTTDASGRRRIDLGPTASERLRSSRK